MKRNRIKGEMYIMKSRFLKCRYDFGVVGRCGHCWGSGKFTSLWVLYNLAISFFRSHTHVQSLLPYAMLLLFGFPNHLPSRHPITTYKFPFKKIKWKNVLVFIYEGDDTDSLSQREAICFTELDLEFGQTHSKSSQTFFQLWLQISLIHPHNLI